MEKTLLAGNKGVTQAMVDDKARSYYVTRR